MLEPDAYLSGCGWASSTNGSIMKKLIPIVGALALSVTGVAASAAPVSAAPLHSQHQAHQQKPRFESHGSYAYYNGHKGYRARHPGYRYYNGYWFPPAAFVFFSILGSIFSQIAR